MIEESILKYSKRGMNLLRNYLEPGYCERAARRLLNLNRGVIFITTGFYVAGYAETDGPVGTIFLAKALKRLGFLPIILTDAYSRGFFEEPGILTRYLPMEAGSEDYEKLLVQYDPQALISIERCGTNKNGDYANMRGISIAPQTARLDLMFDLAAKRGLYTIGVGDGGNEIGMGNLAEIIEAQLSIVPCVVKTEELIIATVSNWGAYGLIAALEMLSGESVVPAYDQVAEYIHRIVRLGSVDGVTKEHTATVDGFSLSVEEEILEALCEDIRHAARPQSA